MNTAVPRVDIGTLGGLSGCQSRKSRPQPLSRVVNYAPTLNFPAAGPPELKSGVLQQALASTGAPKQGVYSYAGEVL